jgi:hypothetical protein
VRAPSPRARVADAAFPSTPGVYVVWGQVERRPLYVGVAATQSIERRWRDQHLRDRSGGSALRRSLGPHGGFVKKKLSVSKDGRYYEADIEKKITALQSDLELEFYECENGEEAVALEAELITELRPLLNSRRPRIKRTIDEKAVLAAAARLYEQHVKPAVLEGLRRSRTEEVELDRDNYILKVAQNILPPLTPEDIEADFKDAAGHELETKMRAPWSSSALAVNSFGRWRYDPSLLELAGRTGFAAGFRFEHPCPNKVSTIHPYLDLILERPGEMLAVESKFTEYLQGSDHPPVAAGYKRLAEREDDRAASRWFAALDHVERFLLLDAYQLVKHYLGIVLEFAREPQPKLTLVYLYWEPRNALEGAGGDLVARHRAEIAEFAKLVGSDPTCAFVSLSYEHHWNELAALPDKPPWLDDHLARLRDRYLVALK